MTAAWMPLTAPICFMNRIRVKEGNKLFVAEHHLSRMNFTFGDAATMLYSLSDTAAKSDSE